MTPLRQSYLKSNAPSKKKYFVWTDVLNRMKTRGYKGGLVVGVWEWSDQEVDSSISTPKIKLIFSVSKNKIK